MPKLNNDEYIARHEELNRIWGEAQSLFTYLTYQQQRDLHDYLVPTKELTREELLAYRRRITRSDPSLPQRAGRAFQAILHPELQPSPPSSPPDEKGRVITVRPLARPEIDVEKLAFALLSYVEKLSPEEKKALIAEMDKKDRKKKAA